LTLEEMGMEREKAMERFIHRQEHYREARAGGRRGFDPPSVFSPDDEWKAFYREMRKYASTDENAAGWAEPAKRVLQDRSYIASHSVDRTPRAAGPLSGTIPKAYRPPVG
jgi:hypothetical protein